MMRNDTFRKTLVLGIIIIFICMSNMSIAGNLKMEKQAFKDLIPFIHALDNGSNISLINVKVAGEMGLNDWYVSEVGVNFTKSNDISLVKYRVDHGQMQDFNESFYITEEGKDIWLEWCALDHEGNQSEVDGPFIFNMDYTEPDVDLTYEYQGVKPPYLFIFTATAKDYTSGMQRVEFWFNGELMETVYGPGPEYVWEFLYEPVPTAYFKAIAYDMAGNNAYDSVRSPPSNIEVLKSFPPYTSTSEEGIVKSYSNDLLKSKIIKKENEPTEESPFDCSRFEIFDPTYNIIVFNREILENGWLVDNASIYFQYDYDRITDVYYQINDGEWILYTEPLIISHDGIHVFSWYVIDLEGYSSIPDSISFKIDHTPPEVNLKVTRQSFFTYHLEADVYDELSGIEIVDFYHIIPPHYYRKKSDVEFPYECYFEEAYRVLYFRANAYDNAGNTGIDKTTFISNNFFNNYNKFV